ncbi:hypothetical protein K4F52_008399 [Lecanicillium sp. MT-2017a]|nr:hypothetical protein K4F52_008399 [Lecanicillium sp. MT-2017a]
MPPRTRSQSLAITPPSNDDISDLDSENDDDGSPKLVQSPTRLTYRLDELPEKTQFAVRDVFSEPPKIAIEHCRQLEDTYAFQMTELVTHSVRIRPSDSGRARLSCSCDKDSNEKEPCGHLLWLLDQLLKQTLYNHDHDEPLTMTRSGYAAEMGDPFQSIDKYHLNILANGLHCPVVGSASVDDDEAIDVERVEESRELLSSLYSADEEEYRPDLVAKDDWEEQLIYPKDLDYTIFRMLLDNHRFFHYFLSHTPSSFSINDPFCRLSRRADRVLRDLDRYSASYTPSQERCSNVVWASDHLIGIVRLIRDAIHSKHYPLAAPESASAARTLVHILHAVAGRNRDAHPAPSRRERNLYLRLIGDQDSGFVVEELWKIPGAASRFLHTLEDIQDKIGAYGAPASYVNKFRSLVARLRAPTANTTFKRSMEEDDNRETKRMK